jgi:hypothetical protein
MMLLFSVWASLIFETFSCEFRSHTVDPLAGIPMTKKKFAELELSLLHLQQNVEIPETHLIIHPTIQKSVEHVRNRVQALPTTRLTTGLYRHVLLAPDRTFPIYPPSF